MSEVVPSSVCHSLLRSDSGVIFNTSFDTSQATTLFDIRDDHHGDNNPPAHTHT